MAVVGTLLTAGMPTPVLAAGLSGPAASEENQAQAKALYDKGRRAYRIGNMKEAIEKFEGAYELTENPLILYNIGLAYTRLYTESQDIKDLRHAKLVLENFSLELSRDPSLGSAEEVNKVLADIDEQIAAAESGQTDEGAGGDATETGDVSDETSPEGPEPGETTPPPAADGDAGRGRTMKIAGFATLGVGVALGVGAGVVAGLFAKKRSDDLAALDNSVAEAEAAGCTSGDETGICGDYKDQREALTLRANLNGGRAVAGGAGLGAGALVGIGAGVALIVIGNKRMKASGGAAARVNVSPWGRGAQLSVRF